MDEQSVARPKKRSNTRLVVDTGTHMLYCSLILYLLLKELKESTSLRKEKECCVLSSSLLFRIVLAPKFIFGYNFKMNILTILSGRRPAGPCGITIIKSLSLPELKDGSSSIVSSSTRTNMRVTDILRLFKAFRKERSYVNWYWLGQEDP